MQLLSASYLMMIFVCLLSLFRPSTPTIQSYNPLRYIGSAPHVKDLGILQTYGEAMELPTEEVRTLLLKPYVDSQRFFPYNQRDLATKHTLSRMCRHELHLEIQGDDIVAEYDENFAPADDAEAGEPQEGKASTIEPEAEKPAAEEPKADKSANEEPEAGQPDGIDLLYIMGNYASELLIDKHGLLIDTVHAEDRLINCEYESVLQDGSKSFHKQIVLRYKDISGPDPANEEKKLHLARTPSYKYYFENGAFADHLEKRAETKRNKFWYMTIKEFEEMRHVVATKPEYRHLTYNERILYGKLLFNRNVYEIFALMRALADVYEFKFTNQLTIGKLESAMFWYLTKLEPGRHCRQVPATISNILFGIEMFSQAYVNCHGLDIEVETSFYKESVSMKLKHYMGMKAPSVAKAVIVLYRAWMRSGDSTLRTDLILEEERAVQDHVDRQANRLYRNH